MPDKEEVSRRLQTFAIIYYYIIERIKGFGYYARTLFLLYERRTDIIRYKTKPVEIEAIQWTGLNLEEIKQFAGESLEYDILDTAWEVGKGRPHIYLRIHTLEGIMNASEGDYIIKGLRGEFYPCKPDVFEKKYEVIRE